MPIVAIYRYQARFLLKPELQKSTGQERIHREGLLLLRQDTPARADDAALGVLGSAYMTVDAVIEEFGVLDGATLDRPEMVQYAPMYRAAMASGHALTYYEPSAFAELPDAKPADGFRPAQPR